MGQEEEAVNDLFDVYAELIRHVSVVFARHRRPTIQLPGQHRHSVVCQIPLHLESQE